MRFKDLGKTILAMVGAAGGAYTVSQTEVVMPVFAQEVQQTEQAALEARIEELMQRPSVEAILAEEFEAGTIQRVTYDQRAGRTNFRELVYQESLELGQRLPVVMFVYHSLQNSRDVNFLNPSKRSAVAIKELRATFNPEELVFVAYDACTDPDSVQREVSSTNTPNVGPELYNEGLKAIPSLFLYSYFDLSEGETPTRNNSIIRLIDINRGGPSNNQSISNEIINCSQYWINQWCFGQDNPDRDQKVYKYENTFKIHEVEIPELSRRALVRN